jgi:peptidoglycan/LPS O-acetylase OafA/YrhL
MPDVRSFGHGVAVVVVAAMSPTTNDGHYRPEIDGLRCIAVIGVLLCHYNIGGFAGGFAGVDVFFVISGYLITGMIMRDIELGTFNFRNFYTRRARRLLPALFFTLLSSLFAAALLFAPERMREFAISLIAASLSASNFLFWSQAGYFDASSSLKPLLHTWSLGVEEQFYLLWPLALVVMSRRRISVQSTLLVLFCASLAASYAWQDHTSTIFYLLPFRIFEFAIGGLTLLLEARLTLSNSARESSAFAGCAMIIASYLVFNEKSHFPSFPALLPCAGAALVILGGSAPRARSVLASSPALAIGRRSYSLYLAHWPIIVFYEYATLTTIHNKARVILIIVTFAIAAAMYKYIEQPFRITRERPPRIATSFGRWAAAATMALVAISATATGDGWLWRLGQKAELYRSATYGGVGCGDRCDTNPDKPVSIYLIGDSHAQQYFAGFKDVFPSLNTRIYQFSSCPFFSLEFTRDFSDYPDPKLYDTGCRSSRRSAFEAINNSGAVVVSQFWINFPLISEKTGQRLMPRDLDEATTLAADQLMVLKRELGIKRLLVIGSVPGMAAGIDNPTDCATRPIVAPSNCLVSRVKAEPQAERAVIDSYLAAKVAPDITFLNPFDALCDQTDCTMIADGKPVYSDPTHLTKWGAEIVVRSFRDRLEGKNQMGLVIPEPTRF